MEEKKKGILDYIILILFVVIFLACLVGVLVYFLKGISGENKMEEVRNSYVTESSQAEGTTENESADQVAGAENSSSEVEGNVETSSYVVVDGVVYPDFAGLNIPEREVDIEGLRSQVNEDIYAWVYIPGTNVDYPILQHSADDEYYLNHDMSHNEVTAGSIFTQNYNNRDFNDNHTVIYGHNMKNGSMFKTLHYYMEEGFMEENPYIYIYLDGETRVYEIFGAYEYSDAHLLLNYDMEDEEVFADYLGEVAGMSDSVGHFNREMELSSGDKIITLSTCIGGKPDKRYLVQAKLIAVECEKED